MKVLHSIASKFGKLSSAHRLEKVSFHSNPKERQCQKCSNYHTIALISYTSKVVPQILQARLQQYVNRELPVVHAGFRNQIANICWITGKVRQFQKIIYFCFIDYIKAFDCGITTNCGKFFKRWEYQTTSPAC